MLRLAFINQVKRFFLLLFTRLSQTFTAQSLTMRAAALVRLQGQRFLMTFGTT